MGEKYYCCGVESVKRQVSHTGMFQIDCKVCGNHVSERSADNANAEFQKEIKPKPEPDKAAEPKQETLDTAAEPPSDKLSPKKNPPPKVSDYQESPNPAQLPATPADLANFAVQNMSDFAALTVPFIAQEKPALVRLLKNNVRHIMQRSKDKKFGDVWGTKEGQESIIYALEEAMALGAELGKMGSLVPYGKVVEFIPAIEAYEFALTNGTNPPFAWIQIDLIYANDIKEIRRVNGEFTCDVKPGIPRGTLESVAVYGMNNRLRHVIGEVYDVERLLGKAKMHSSSYKYYLDDLHAFKVAMTEGKMKTEGGRQYLEKKMGYGDKAWTKKIFEDDITNPYEGPDQPEMLRKAAGKSFLGKYARVRNSEAAMDEMKGTEERQVEKVIDDTIDAAFDIVEQDGAGMGLGVPPSLGCNGRLSKRTSRNTW